MLFIQCLKVTFHVQFLPVIGSVSCVVQYIPEPLFYPVVCTPTSLPLHCPSHHHHWQPLVCSLYKIAGLGAGLVLEQQGEIL